MAKQSRRSCQLHSQKSNVYNRLQYSRVLLRKGRIRDYQVAQTLFQSEAKSEEIVKKML